MSQHILTKNDFLLELEARSYPLTPEKYQKTDSRAKFPRQNSCCHASEVPASLISEFFDL